MVEVDGVPWNASVNEAAGVIRSGTDELSMAQDFLRAVVELAETGQEAEFFFWEYSNAEIAPVGADMVSLVDHGIVPAGEGPVFPPLLVRRAELIEGFASATRSYLGLARGVVGEAERWIERTGGDLGTARLRAATCALDVAGWERLLERLVASTGYQAR